MANETDLGLRVLALAIIEQGLIDLVEPKPYRIRRRNGVNKDNRETIKASAKEFFFSGDGSLDAWCALGRLEPGTVKKRAQEVLDKGIIIVRSEEMPEQETVLKHDPDLD